MGRENKTLKKSTGRSSQWRQVIGIRSKQVEDQNEWNRTAMRQWRLYPLIVNRMTILLFRWMNWKTKRFKCVNWIGRSRICLHLWICFSPYILCLEDDRRCDWARCTFTLFLHLVSRSGLRSRRYLHRKIFIPDVVVWAKRGISYGIVCGHLSIDSFGRAERLQEKSNLKQNESIYPTLWRDIDSLSRELLEKMVLLKPVIQHSQNNDLICSYCPWHFLINWNRKISDC